MSKEYRARSCLSEFPWRRLYHRFCASSFCSLLAPWFLLPRRGLQLGSLRWNQHRNQLLLSPCCLRRCWHMRISGAASCDQVVLHIHVCSSPVSFANMSSKSLIDDINQGRECRISESVPTGAVGHNLSCSISGFKLGSLLERLEKYLDKKKEPSLLKGGASSNRHRMVLPASHLRRGWLRWGGRVTRRYRLLSGGWRCSWNTHCELGMSKNCRRGCYSLLWFFFFVDDMVTLKQNSCSLVRWFGQECG